MGYEKDAKHIIFKAFQIGTAAAAFMATGTVTQDLTLALALTMAEVELIKSIVFFLERQLLPTLTKKGSSIKPYLLW